MLFCAIEVTGSICNFTYGNQLLKTLAADLILAE